MVDRDEVRRRHGFHLVPVKRVIDETEDTRSFVLDVPAELRETFRYEAGQFCTFRVRLGDSEHLRCYSMSSAPETDDDLAVTVKRVPGGVVSNWFNDDVAAGDVLELTKPAGAFCVREGDRPVVAFCGGSGVTPVISIAKSVLDSTPRRMKLLYANRTATSVIFCKELERLHRRHPDRFAVQHHVDSKRGFVDADAIVRFVGRDIEAECYICGPGPFMDLVETTLLALGVPPERIHLERFVTAFESSGASVAEATLESVGSGRELVDGGGVVVPGDGSADAGAIPETVRIILSGVAHDVGYRAGDTLLETARRGAVPAPSSCEAGNCATCMAHLDEGTAKMRVNDALTPEEVDDGWVLTCQAIPSGRTVIVQYEEL